jgi:iron complex transport system substrate-binding protein
LKKAALFILIFFIAVKAYAREPRIVSLAPNTTEILFALGLADCVVAVDRYSDYPEEAKNIKRLGDFNDPNIENLILLRPGYILVNTDMPADRRSYLEGLGVNIVKVSPKTVEGLLRDIERLGDLFNRRQKAFELTEDIKVRLKALPSGGKKNRPKVFIQLFDDPLITVSSFISDVIRLAGGENVASDIKEDTGLFSMEELIKRDPDVIIVIGFSSGSVIPSSVKAVRDNRMIRNINPDILLRPGPRVIDAIEALSKLFYEEN